MFLHKVKTKRKHFLTDFMLRLEILLILEDHLISSVFLLQYPTKKHNFVSVSSFSYVHPAALLTGEEY